ncbi:hypothetical protein OG298_35560 [Streptomyces sp. NBC_01005]|uniref:hypothetical protein n=1 Tax=unclassified Streptomyces TaxID=2593676 RepID=UPI003869E643|nr:hypothetical protein OG298_35560 [Streptomyces sp. NBC_01005]WTD00419.1 hypothetical protein OH736_35560 [Streptomyces sp. NBC_01650]
MWCTPPFIALYCEACNDSAVRAGHEPARGVLKERLRGVQAAGAGLALVGTVLLSTG